MTRLQEADPAEVPLKGIAGRTTRISDQINAAPLPFLALIFFSEMPPMTDSAAEELIQCASYGKIDPDFPCLELSAWERRFEEAGETVATQLISTEICRLTAGEGNILRDPIIYLLPKEDILFLQSGTLRAYERGVRILKNICPLSARPMRRVSMAMTTAQQVILEPYDLLTLAQEMSEDDEPEQGGELEEANAILAALMENHNEGIVEPDEALARRLGVDEELVTQLHTGMESTFSRQAHAGLAADRYGLSPKAFHTLSTSAVPSAPGAFRLREPEEIEKSALAAAGVQQNPFERASVFRLARRLIEQGVTKGDGIRLTPAGYLDAGLVAELAREEIIDTVGTLHGGELHIPKKEKDWPQLMLHLTLLEKAGLIFREEKRLAFSEEAGILLEAPAALYHLLLTTMFERVSWTENRYFPPDSMLQRMAGFLFYAAGRLGAENGDGWFDISALCNRLIAAIPGLADRIGEEPEPDLEEEIGITPRYFLETGLFSAFILSFARPFDLLEIRNGPPFTIGGPHQLRPTKLYGVCFEDS